jgi:hypothetical protein
LKGAAVSRRVANKNFLLEPPSISILASSCDFYFSLTLILLHSAIVRPEELGGFEAMAFPLCHRL